MSQENVDLVMRLVPDVDFVPLFRDDEAWAHLAASVERFYEPDCMVLVRGLPGGDRTYAGLEGIKSVWVDWLAPWETYRAAVEKAIDFGERVLLLHRSFGRLVRSTTEVKAELATAWNVRDGKVAGVVFHATTHAEALEAEGLSELSGAEMELVGRLSNPAFVRKLRLAHA